MNYDVKKPGETQAEITVTVTPEDYQVQLEQAAQRLSEKKAIKGFRKGKAPLEMIKKEFGDMAIMQEAIEDIVKSHFYTAIKEEGLETIGMPQINLEKLAPDNDIVFKATVALLPNVQLADIKKISVKRKAADVDEKKITETLDAVRGMQAKEVAKEGEATDKDKVVLDMNMTLDNVPVEGGQATDHQVYLSEKHYLPDFNKQILGLKKGDEKEFTITFPDDHYQKHLAGKNVDVKVNVKKVYERQLPELSDELAKTLGQDSVDELKKLVRNNLAREAEQKAEQKAEAEILDTMIEKSTFDPLPDVLLDAERERIFYELQEDLKKHGVTIEQYLQDIKKNEQELMQDFTKQAEKRAKAALISREVAKEHGLDVNEEELDAEMERLKETYQNNKEYLDNLKKPGVRETVATTLQNRKVMEWLKEQVLEEK